MTSPEENTLARVLTDHFKAKLAIEDDQAPTIKQRVENFAEQLSGFEKEIGITVISIGTHSGPAFCFGNINYEGIFSAYSDGTLTRLRRIEDEGVENPVNVDEFIKTYLELVEAKVADHQRIIELSDLLTALQ